MARHTLPLLGLILLAPAIAAAGIFHDEGTATWTGPSGQGAARKAQLLVEPYYGLQSLKLHQYDSRACAISIGRSALNTRRVSFPREQLRVCEPDSVQKWQQADLGAGKFLNAIAVCTASKDDARITGIEMWGATVSQSGEVTPKPQSVKFEIGACKEWSERQSCPEGSIATGLGGHHRDAKKEGFVGLSLRCNKLEVRNNE